MEINATRKLRDWIGTSDGDFDVGAEFNLVCNCVKVGQTDVVEVEFDAKGLIENVVVKHLLSVGCAESALDLE